jgi:hypothetical protein
MSDQSDLTKPKILELIQAERADLEGTLARLSDEQMTRPGVEGGWSVKDLLAHLTVWETRMVEWIGQSLRGEVPERPAPGMTWDDLDRLNEETYLLYKDRSLSEALSDFHTTYRRAMEVVSSLQERDLLDPQRFAWRQGAPLWHMVAANTWEHYQEHHAAISHWLTEEA